MDNRSDGKERIMNWRAIRFSLLLILVILNLGLFAAGAVLYGNNIYPRLGKFLMMLAVWLELAMGHFARSWDNVWSRYF